MTRIDNGLPTRIDNGLPISLPSGLFGNISKDPTRSAFGVYRKVRCITAGPKKIRELDIQFGIPDRNYSLITAGPKKIRELDIQFGISDRNYSLIGLIMRVFPCFKN